MKINKRVLLSTAAIAIGALISAAAYAHLAYSATIFYYSDATFTQKVGTQYQLCSGAKPVQGIETNFSVETNVQSCGSSGFECGRESGPCF